MKLENARKLKHGQPVLVPIVYEDSMMFIGWVHDPDGELATQGYRVTYEKDEYIEVRVKCDGIAHVQTWGSIFLKTLYGATADNLLGRV